MKLFSFFLIAISLFTFTSCETTREITLTKDGSGTVLTTTDMSSLIGLAKMSGKGAELEDMEAKAIDTSVALEKVVDSIPDLTPAEKALVKKGTFGYIMNMADEKFVTKLNFPFTNTSELDQLDKLSSKVIQQAIKKQMASAAGDAASNTGLPPADAMPQGTISDYFTTTFSKGIIEKKLIPEKYSHLESDKGMQSMKEANGQGLPIKSTLIINLPKKAKKVEGKNAKLSSDGMKVTIEEPLDEFFEDGKNLEFRIEY